MTSTFDGVTVFGPRTAATEEAVRRQVTLLYGEQELSEKEKKKMAKMTKFLKKVWCACNRPTTWLWFFLMLLLSGSRTDGGCDDDQGACRGGQCQGQEAHQS